MSAITETPSTSTSNSTTPLIKSPFTRSLLVHHPHNPPSKTLPPLTPLSQAGALAGTTVDLSLYPLDTLKTRLQSSKPIPITFSLARIYSGVGSALVGSAPSAALFFTTYESSKSFLRHLRLTEEQLAGGPGQGTLSTHAEPIEHMLAASLGEVAACAVRVPTEVVKQRAQAGQYARSRQALVSILNRRSNIGLGGVWRELYRGWNATILREVPFTIIQFPLWEGLKTWRVRSSGRGEDGTVTAIESAVFGSIAGAVAAGVTTPLDVLKTRMMLARERPKGGMVGMLTQILRESGPRAFFAGIGPRMIWISLGGAIFLGSYQWGANVLEGGMKR
ncbi:MAG: S-adenosylmethionine transporter [Cirrosporium novae-zelandiae]|nr:MAG: S-adenosylmethionine transporter [Cirrosporium novae-zelandiae]